MGTAAVTKFISTAMGAFDTLALFDKAFGDGLIAKFNAKLHESKVYNFQVEDYHTYCVGEDGIWVHNANCTVSKDGDIEITDWDGYPEDGSRPEGKMKMVEGDEYKAARNAANAENASMHRTNPQKYTGKQIHEVKPVKFGGSPTDHSNKIALTPSEHREYSNFWARIKAIAKSAGR